jgi:hypothetical protein
MAAFTAKSIACAIKIVKKFVSFLSAFIRMMGHCAATRLVGEMQSGSLCT